MKLSISHYSIYQSYKASNLSKMKRQLINLIKKIILHFIPTLRPSIERCNEEQRTLGIIFDKPIPQAKYQVALTFDDGPSCTLNKAHDFALSDYDNESTHKILDILKEFNSKATFFICGEHCASPEGAEALKRIQQEGHEIGVHCWSHSENLIANSLPDIYENINATKKIIKDITGTEPTLMRPPRGEIEKVTTQFIFSHTKLRIVLWTVASRDWLLYTTEQSVNHIKSNIEPGSIILMHDIYNNTPHTLKRILKELSEQNVKFVTVSQLIEDSKSKDKYFQIKNS